MPARASAPLGRPAAYSAELIGTFGLVLFIVLVLTISAAPPPFGIGGPDFAVVGLVHAFALMLLIAALGGVCGTHFNPAVTVGMLSTRRIGLGDACAYIVMQLAGAVVAVLLVKALMNGSGTAARFGAPKVVSGRFLDGSALKGLVAETIGAFFLMWAIMGTVVNPRGDRAWGAFVIGATLGLAVMCIASLIGAGLNPARAFGPALFGGFARRATGCSRSSSGPWREPCSPPSSIGPRHRPRSAHRGRRDQRRRSARRAGARSVRTARHGSVLNRPF